MKKGLVVVLFFSLVLLGTFVGAQVVINEVESNPAAGSEWVEIYNNDGVAVNISMWKIFDGLVSETLRHTIPVGTFISANGFYTANVTGLNDGGEFVILKDNLGNIINQTPTLNDTADDNRTWSRNPDGTGNFIFQNGTRGFSNNLSANQTIICNSNLDCNDNNSSTLDICNNPGTPQSSCSHTIINQTTNQTNPVNINTSSTMPSCILETNNVTISAYINGSIQTVTLALNTNGTWRNISLFGNLPGIYQHIVRANEFLSGSSTIFWQFFVKDNLNNAIIGPLENRTIKSITRLTITPPAPTGMNSWYVSEPEFELTNPDATKIFYRWNGNRFNYTAPFGLSGTPNNGNISGGTLGLRYNSDVCNETEKEFIGKFDFMNPIIMNLVPEINETIFSQNVLISAYIDEFYSGNSGINISSVKLYLDNLLMNANKSSAGIDAVVSYFANNLPLGQHLVNVTATDNSGRTTQTSWRFTNSGLEQFIFNLNSPLEGIYNSRRIQVNLSASREAEQMEYINYNDRNQRFRRLCSNCEEFGQTRAKFLTANEGENNITFRATGILGEVLEENVAFIVDSKYPKIIKTTPKDEFASGIFSVEFVEKNLIGVILNYGTAANINSVNVDLSNECFYFDGKVYCETGVDLSEFEAAEISYWFAVSDVIGNVAESPEVRIKVDSISPNINAFNYSVNGRKVTFVVNVDDLNFDSVVYIDELERNPRFRKLCSRLDSNGFCRKTVTLSRGEHNLDIFAFDKAGNGAIVAEDLVIFVDGQ